MNFQAQHQSLAQYDAYHGKSAETRHLKPGELSTGTTIMAVAFEGGVVLCAGAVLTSIHTLCLCSTVSLNCNTTAAAANSLFLTPNSLEFSDVVDFVGNANWLFAMNATMHVDVQIPGCQRERTLPTVPLIRLHSSMIISGAAGPGPRPTLRP